LGEGWERDRPKKNRACKKYCKSLHLKEVIGYV
jgi:hypothetical protein